MARSSLFDPYADGFSALGAPPDGGEAVSIVDVPAATQTYTIPAGWVPPQIAFAMWRSRLAQSLPGFNLSSPTSFMRIYRWMFGEKHPKWTKGAINTEDDRRDAAKSETWSRRPKLIEGRDFVKVPMRRTVKGVDESGRPVLSRPKHYLFVDPAAIDRIDLSGQRGPQARTVVGQQAVDRAIEAHLDSPEGMQEEQEKAEQMDAGVAPVVVTQPAPMPSEEATAATAAETAATVDVLFTYFPVGPARKRAMLQNSYRRTVAKKNYPVPEEDLIAYAQELGADRLALTQDDIDMLRLRREEQTGVPQPAPDEPIPTPVRVPVPTARPSAPAKPKKSWEEMSRDLFEQLDPTMASSPAPEPIQPEEPELPPSLFTIYDD